MTDILLSADAEDADSPHYLRALTDNVTEVWIALAHDRLPVQIRFTDKKGDSFEQVATELGSP